jgi:hypothetical protein
MMSKPQSPEIARNRLGSQDQDGRELRVDDHLPEGDDHTAPVPEANQPGHRPEQDQDKPETPPR